MPTLQLFDIHRRFGALQALGGVSLSLRGGRVHGVLGENGAGKSTLMSIAYGLINADAGRIVLDGRELRLSSPRGAIAAGIGMVHQHFMLAPAMSVLDNVLLGDGSRGLFLRRADAEARLVGLGESLGLAVDPRATVGDLSVGQQQRVEILKALFRDARVLILDEPTAVLTPGETRQLLSAMSRLRDQGAAIAFISHKLSEVKAICEDLTVLRRGQVVWEGPAKEVSVEEIAGRMVGEELSSVDASARPHGGTSPVWHNDSNSVVQFEGISAEGVNDATFSIGGEILGIAGVDGNGQQELAEVVVGLRGATSGRIVLDGVDITQLSTLARAELGIAHIPNDRKLEGLIPSMSIAENLAMKHYRAAPFSWRGLMRWSAVRARARELIQQFDVRASSADAPASSLSGGNAQKVVLARELSVSPPRLVVAMNPTRGLDPGATRYVRRQLLQQKQRGAAVMLISSELDELIEIADRIAVLYRGRLSISSWPAGGIEPIGHMMAGVKS